MRKFNYVVAALAILVFTIIAGCGGGGGGSVGSTTPPDAAAKVPGAPQGASLSISGTTATITVTPPSSDGGSPITKYTAILTPGNLSKESSGTSITIAGLSPLTTYTCTVTATNAVGTSPASSQSNTAKGKLVLDNAVQFGAAYGTSKIMLSKESDGIYARKCGPVHNVIGQPLRVFSGQNYYITKDPIAIAGKTSIFVFGTDVDMTTIFSNLTPLSVLDGAGQIYMAEINAENMSVTKTTRVISNIARIMDICYFAGDGYIQLMTQENNTQYIRRVSFDGSVVLSKDLGKLSFFNKLVKKSAGETYVAGDIYLKPSEARTAVVQLDENLNYAAGKDFLFYISGVLPYGASVRSMELSPAGNIILTICHYILIDSPEYTSVFSFDTTTGVFTPLYTANGWSTLMLTTLDNQGNIYTNHLGVLTKLSQTGAVLWEKKLRTDMSLSSIFINESESTLCVFKYLNKTADANSDPYFFGPTAPMVYNLNGDELN